MFIIIGAAAAGHPIIVENPPLFPAGYLGTNIIKSYDRSPANISACAASPDTKYSGLLHNAFFGDFTRYIVVGSNYYPTDISLLIADNCQLGLSMIRMFSWMFGMEPSQFLTTNWIIIIIMFLLFQKK